MKDWTAFLSPMISGAALIWAVYQFVIKRSEERASKKQNDLEKLLRQQQNDFDHVVKDLNHRIATQEMEFKKQKDEYVKMKVGFVEMSTKVEISSKVQAESSARIEKVLDRHEAKLDNFGKVIVK